MVSQFDRAGVYASRKHPTTSAAVNLSASGTLHVIGPNSGSDSAVFSATGALSETSQVRVSAAPRLSASGTLTAITGGGPGNHVVKVNADQLQDSIGVVIHPTYAEYQSMGLDLITSSMVDLGITHYRTAVFQTTPITSVQSFYTGAGAAGLIAHIVTDKAWPASGGAAMLTAISSRFGLANVSSAEGINEPDAAGGGNTNAKAVQAGIYPYFKSQASWNPRPFIGVSEAHPEDYASYGADNNLDYINLHGYEQHFNSMPENGRLDTWINDAQAVFGKRPYWNTEHGYVNGVGNQDGGVNAWVPEDVSGDYLIRAFLYEKVMKDVFRHFIYELFDEAGKGLREGNFGLVHTNGTPKESYVRIKRFLGRLKDTGTGTAATSVSYSANNSGDVQVIPISRKDGSYDLMVWRATSIWDAGTVAGTVPGYITVTPINVAFTLPAAKRITTFTPDDGLTATVSTSTTSFTIPADGRMKMVRVS